MPEGDFPAFRCFSRARSRGHGSPRSNCGRRMTLAATYAERKSEQADLRYDLSAALSRRGLRPRVPRPVAGTRAEATGTVRRVRVPAAVERQTAAPDALREAILQALELGDPLLDPLLPPARETVPVAPGGGPVHR